jgi:hypothetical protein
MRARLASVLVVAALSLGLPGAARSQVGSWLLDGKITVQVSVAGRTARKSQHGQSLLIIDGDGTYSQPGNALCSGETLSASEVGTWHAVRRGIVLQPQNANDLLQDLAGCVGAARLRIRRYRHRVFPLGDGTIRVKTTMSGGGSVSGYGFSFTAVGRFHGTPTSAALTSLPRRSSLLELTTGLARGVP